MPRAVVTGAILICCLGFLLRVRLEEIQENVENGIAHNSTLRLTL